MEVRPGYKQTEVGVIPQEWNVSCLGAHGATYGGLTGKTKQDFGSGNAQYVTFMNVMSNVVIDRDRFERVRVGESESQNLVRVGDLVFNGSSETPEEVALCAVVLEECPNLYLNSFCFGYRPLTHTSVDPLFLVHLFRSPTGRELVKSLAQGSTRYNISKGGLLGASIALPPLPEQRAIAAVLGDVDALLDGLDRLIAKKRDLKQATLQQLLTGQTRLAGFDGTWDRIRLGDVAHVEKGSGLSKSCVSESGIHPCILYGELFTTYGHVITSVVSRTSSTEGRSSLSGDVLMPSSTTTTGADLAVASALLLDDVALGGDILIIRRRGDRYVPAFLAAYLTIAKRREIAELTQGITIHHLYGKHVESLDVHLPSLAEQTAIASVLSDMDAELAALEARRDKTRDLKQAMMQELLTGKTRLVPAGAAHD